MNGGLSDVKVLELGTTVTAPYAAQALSSMGADVIKIEPPTGDPFRMAGAGDDDIKSSYFAMCNCGKRSLKLNLKEPAGLDAFMALAADADVILENNRPGVVDRLGVGYKDVKSVSDDIIYCSLSGYGQNGVWSHRAGFDPILQGDTGLMSVTGEKDGSPVRIGVAVIDLMTGLWSVTAIMNALRVRDQTGEGAYLDMGMYDVGISMLTKRAVHYYNTGENPERMGTEDSWSVPYGAYPTADDELIMIGAPWQRLWEKLCELIGREELIDDDRFETKFDRIENREPLNAILREQFRTKTRNEWLDILQDELPAGAVRSVSDALTNEHNDYRDVETEVTTTDGQQLKVLNLPITMNGEKHNFETPPPQLGEHSREVLLEAGYSNDEIDSLESADVI